MVSEVPAKFRSLLVFQHSPLQKNDGFWGPKTQSLLVTSQESTFAGFILIHLTFLRVRKASIGLFWMNSGVRIPSSVDIHPILDIYWGHSWNDNSKVGHQC